MCVCERGTHTIQQHNIDVSMVIFRFGQYSYLLLLWGAHQMAGITPPFTASHVSSIQTHTHTHVLLSDDSKSQQSNACNLVRTVKAALTHSKTHTHTYIQYIYIQYTILQSDTVCLSLYIQYIYANSVFNPSPHTHTHSLSLSRISVRFGFGHVLVNNIQRRLFIPIVFHFNFFSETKSDGSCRPSPSLPFVQTHFKARHLHSLSLVA